jgi:FtsP/CotA-like multicopper oxidase with cupredoxin domain
VDFQAGTSAGPLIVQDEGSPPFHYDEERIVFLSDYFNRTDQNITAGLLANPFKWSGETNSLLVNGQSGMASNMTALCAPAIFNVEPDKTYRLWFIGSTALSFISLAFEDYTDLSIIEADGTYTKPFLTPYLQVGTGQRFSVLFKTKSVAELKAAGKTDFWIQLENRERPHQWLVPTQYSSLILFSRNTIPIHPIITSPHSPTKNVRLSRVLPPASPSRPILPVVLRSNSPRNNNSPTTNQRNHQMGTKLGLLDP